MTSDWVAQALATLDADAQARFLNEFYRSLKLTCRGRHETQLCYIADCLDDNGREFLREMDLFSKLSVESRAKLETELQDLYRQKHEIEKELAEVRKARETARELLELDGGAR
jgi:uncharacterized membrane protein